MNSYKVSKLVFIFCFCKLVGVIFGVWGQNSVLFARVAKTRVAKTSVKSKRKTKKTRKKARKKKSKKKSKTRNPVIQKHVCEKSTKKFLIRVLLQEHSAKPRNKFVIYAPHGFVLKSPEKTKRHYTSLDKLHVIVKNNTIYLRDKTYTYRKVKNKSLSITPVQGLLHINDATYQGNLTFALDQTKNKLLLVNKLDLDDYIYSVLRFESLSYWPLEMQKVQAIISRTYAIYQMNQNRNKKSKNTSKSKESTKHKFKNKFYDIKNTNFHQVYNGSHSCTHLRQAVYDTHNIILMYDNTVALTMFDVCCGGITPERMKKKDDDKPYLFKRKRCTFCRNRKTYRWQEKFSKRALWQKFMAHPRVSRKVKRVGGFKGIKIKEKDKAGIVQSILVLGSKRNVILNGQELKNCLLAQLKSLAFGLKKEKNKYIFTGRGFGHNTGLCQVGAREMVARNRGYKKILEYYYPGTKLARLL